jgi:hypothetical protein
VQAHAAQQLGLRQPAAPKPQRNQELDDHVDVGGAAVAVAVGERQQAVGQRELVLQQRVPTREEGVRHGVGARVLVGLVDGVRDLLHQRHQLAAQAQVVDRKVQPVQLDRQRQRGRLLRLLPGRTVADQRRKHVLQRPNRGRENVGFSGFPSTVQRQPAHAFPQRLQPWYNPVGLIW